MPSLQMSWERSTNSLRHCPTLLDDFQPEDVMSGRITLLPSETRALLRSTVILTTLPQVVSELVQNALDAGSSDVSVTLDASEWMCLVRDNGHGMSSSDLAHLGKGSDGNRYGKYNSCVLRRHCRGPKSKHITHYEHPAQLAAIEIFRLLPQVPLRCLDLRP